MTTTQTRADTAVLDVAVVGGGPAGLQAALTLGRMRRRVALIDSGSYRNDPTSHLQNLIGFDGRAPGDLRAAARADLARYATVALREAAVKRIAPVGAAEEPAFELVLHDEAAGERVLRARRVLLATGVADTLPEVPGLAERFGDRIAHCPYCHGFELADGPIAFYRAGAHTAMQAALVTRLATRILVLLDGAEPDPALRAQLERQGVELVPERVRAIGDHTSGLAVELEGADALVLSGMFVAPTLGAAAPFAEQLGLERTETGGIVVDAFGRTSMPGVSAAGDAAQGPHGPMSAVATSIASGMVAASMLDRELALLDAGMPTPV